MSYFKEQYTRLRHYVLERKLDQVSVSRNPGNYSNAKKIGILFNATDPTNRSIVLDYAEQLKKDGKQVQLLGFYDTKSEEPNFTFKHFTQKELNFLRHPSGNIVEAFQRESFDILISLFLGEEPALEFITALSTAHLRVGPYTERTYCYDLMIDTSDRQDLNKFITQVTTLLNKVNKTSHESTTA